MSQHDFTIDNQTHPAFRADLNLALKALAEQNSGPTAPTTTFPYMFWADTTTGKLKQRNAANTAWVEIAPLAAQALTHFELFIQNTAGIIQHKITRIDGTGNSGFAQAINGNSNVFTNTPLVNNVTGFSAAGGIEAANLNHFIFDSLVSQVSDLFIFSAGIGHQDTGSNIRALSTRQNLDVNGSVLTRPTLNFYDAATGADFDLTVGNIAASEFIRVNCHGYWEV